MKKVDVNVPCVVCGGNGSLPFMELSFREFRYPGLFQLRKCKTCDLIFNSPRLCEEELKKMYEENYYFFNEPAEKALARIKCQYLRSIALLENMPERKKIIEVGSAKGYQLALLSALGWEVQGVEISSFAAEFSEKTFNIPVFRGTAELYAAECKTQYDVAVAFDVIEHVLDPARFVTALASLVKVGGFLILDTPNRNSKHIQEHRELWSGFIPFHIYFFNKENLSCLLEKSGFCIQKAFTYNNALISYQERKRMIEPNLRERFYEVLGVRRVLANLKYMWLTRMETKGWLNKKIRDIAKEVQGMLTYFETADAKLPLFETGEGENLVVIAKKV